MDTSGRDQFWQGDRGGDIGVVAESADAAGEVGPAAEEQVSVAGPAYGGRRQYRSERQREVFMRIVHRRHRILVMVDGNSTKYVIPLTILI
jgi:hypothetical protein